MKRFIVFRPITVLLLYLVTSSIIAQSNSDCITHRNLFDDITADTYNAAQTIIAKGAVQDNASVIFNAGESITLQNGFHTPKNSTVTMKIKTCDMQQTADLVYRNGKIYTANDEQPFAEAIAFKDGKIIFVGDNENITPYIGATTTVEDFSGKLMLPGFHDVHMHPLEAGSPIGGGCLLDGLTENPNSLKTALQNCNLSPNANGWIMAFGHSIFAMLPLDKNSRYAKAYLDDLYPNTPAVVMEETSHSVWVNSKALEVLNITATTPDPDGGHILKDASNGNEPTGILMDNAGDVALSAALVPNAAIDAQNKAGLVEYSLPLLARNGITSIVEARTYWKRNYHQIWQSIKSDGDLTCRVMLNPWLYPDDTDAFLLSNLQNLYDEGDDLLKSRQVKVYSDGITINATAALHEPYNYSWDLPFNKGLTYFDENRLTTMITALEDMGYDFHIHAIGDRGVTNALNAIENARNTNGDIGARHRITHLEIVKSTDYPRFNALNVTADMQVTGPFTQPNNWSDNNFLIGANRSNPTIPLKDIFNANARVTLSSDWDVSSVNPFVGIQNALTRAPQNLATLEDAIKAYTINGAYVMRQEDKTGSLEVGKYADFIIIDRDVFSVATNQIKNAKVQKTYLAGEQIYPATNNLLVQQASNRNKKVTQTKIEKDLAQLDFQLFPTITTHFSMIQVKGKTTAPITAQIFTIGGQLIKEFTIQHQDSFSQNPLNVAFLPEGMYYVMVFSKMDNFKATKPLYISR